MREALAACREGDTLVVTKLDRLARSLPDARAIAEEHPDRFVVVDATGTPAAVHARVVDALGRLLAGEDVGRSGAT